MTRSFEHGANAAGGSHVQRGFARTPEEDLAFALGFPYVSVLVDGHPDDGGTVEERAENVVKGTYAVELPKRIALARARAWPVMRMTSTPGAYDTALVQRTVENSDPMTAAEARAIIMAAVAHVDTIQVYVLRTLRILEAFVGPSELADAVVAALEALSNEKLAEAGPAAMFARYLGFSLLRVTKPEAEALRGRMEALTARVPTEFFKRSARESLDIALGRLQNAPDDAVFLYGQPAKVLELVKADKRPKYAPNARLVFLGGDPVIDFYEEKWKKIDTYTVAEAALGFAPMAGERARAFAKKLGATRSSRR